MPSVLLLIKERPKKKENIMTILTKISKSKVYHSNQTIQGSRSIANHFEFGNENFDLFIEYSKNFLSQRMHISCHKVVRKFV